MNKLTLTALSAAMCLALNGGAMAAFGKPPEFKADKEKIEATYKSDKAACKAMTGNAKDICMEEAKGREKVARAELDQKFDPSPKHTKDVRMAKAKAAYEVAKERCDDKSGNDKDVCRKEAKAQYVSAKADTKVMKETADANTKARDKVASVKKDAAEDKRDAAYAAAKEKCDALSGDAKDNCVKQAKARYGHS